MNILVTKREGGPWLLIGEAPPPYKAIWFLRDPLGGSIWDCVLRRFR